MYVELLKALYGTVKATRLFWEQLTKHLVDDWGFSIDPYDRCVENKMVNRHQCTIVWQVDDLKISHHVESVVNDIIRKLNAEFGQCDNTSVSKGRVHDYLGMQLDYTVPGTLKFSMIDYIDTILDDCLDRMDGTSVTPSASHLFKVNDIDPEYLSVKDAEAFYHLTMQLAYLAHHPHPAIRTAVTFLQTRVQCPDWDDLKKLSWVIKYLW